MKKILNIVIDLMIDAHKKDNLITGEQKKKYVLDAVRSILQYPDDIEDIIIDFIDIIIDVEKGKITINKDIKTFFNCFICQ